MKNPTTRIHRYRALPWPALILFSATVILIFGGGGGGSTTDGNDNHDSRKSFLANAVVTVTEKANKNLKSPVIDLTAKNFANLISSSHVWLVEFYSPRCSHCVEFTPVYKDIARYYHEENPKLKIKVAKVNGEIEQALLSRFGVKAYPTFFVIDGWSVYEFTRNRSKASLMAYVEGEYKTDGGKIPFYSSPMGPFGMVQGTVIAIGYSVGDVLTWMQSHWGISPVISAMLLFGSVFFGIFVTIVAMAIFIPPSTGRPKID